jgi:hypothetical protein
VKLNLVRRIRLLSTMFLVTAALDAESGGGLKWTVPAQWRASVDPQIYELAIPHSVSAKTGAVCVVGLFPLEPGVASEDGGRMGSTVDALASWRNEFLPGAEFTLRHRVIHGITVETLDVSGSIKARVEGFAQLDYQRLVAVAQGPRGRLVIFVNGPRLVVSGHRTEFEGFVRSIRRE